MWYHYSVMMGPIHALQWYRFADTVTCSKGIFIWWGYKTQNGRQESLQPLLPAINLYFYFINLYIIRQSCFSIIYKTAFQKLNIKFYCPKIRNNMI